MSRFTKRPHSPKRVFILATALCVTILLVLFQNIMNSNSKKIDEHGFWVGENVMDEHCTDPILREKLITFFKEREVKTIIDLGAGPGEYAKVLNQNGFFTSCFDGNPDTQSLSQGRCAVLDLATPIAIQKHDWVLSLEVGEHIPSKYEEVFLNNLDRVNIKGIVLSWAIPGQPGHGHFNTRTNEYIKEKLARMGYKNDIQAEKNLREGLKSHFKNTIMVFVRS